MILVGLDPSFSCAGVSVIDTEEKEIKIADVRKKIGKKTFTNIFTTSLQIHRGIKMIIESTGKEPDMLISEKPYPGGRFSSGLYTLDGTLFLELFYRYNSFQEVYLITPRFLSHVHSQNGIKSYSKSDSTKLVRNGLIPIFEDAGYNVEYGIKYDEREEFKGGLNNNTAESFIFLTRLFIRLNNKHEFVKDANFIDNLYEQARGLFSDKEQLLFKRKDVI